MMVVVSYDVSTVTDGGKRRLRRVAKECLNYGHRVQNSVFECLVDPVQFVLLKHRLLEIIDYEVDGIRFYFLGNNWKSRVECYGNEEIVSMDDPIVL